MTDKIVVLSTAETDEQARQIARELVERRLAACVNIIPGLRSVYAWKGAVEEACEWLLVIKTSHALLPALQEAVEQLHSYELPEVLVLPISGGSERYLEWLGASLKSSEGPR